MGPIVALFNFTIRQTLLDRKIWLSVLMLAAPCALLVLIRKVAPPIEEADELWEMYHSSVQFLLILVLVPLVCLVHGTALIGADMEALTIVHLTTRRMRRATVLLVKFVATALVLAALCDLAMVSLHISVFAWRDGPPPVISGPTATLWNPTGDLRCYLFIIPLAVLSFLAIFTLIGVLAARPMALSVFYVVVFELVLSNIPLRVRVYSVLHHLRVSMVAAIPRLSGLFELRADLREELYPEDASALPALFGIVLVGLLFSCVLITVRELVPTKVARE